ncbi:MAG: hypothetical protein DHS20C16_03600 [Phycisphaerae bacterium]|nr:MAG: hypothetical protein DHS20C16_03600 [Phycisphaerae bacterium]
MPNQPVRITSDVLSRIMRVVRRVERQPEVRRERRGPVGGGGSSRFFLARIDDFAPLSANRWKYGFTQMTVNTDKTFVVLNGGRTETTTGNYAINIHEGSNTGAGVEGHSVNIDGIDYPGGFELQPVGGRQDFDSGSANYNNIGNNVIVQMWTVSDTEGSTVYCFEYCNADDGTCEA